MHQTTAGGYLDVHADFNVHPRTKLLRRLNVLLYLNPGWRDDYGGELELWDRGMTRCVVRIAPLFNRCVVFTTSDESFHGHPHPLATPPGVTRKSLALYYYSLAPGARNSGRNQGHNTLFMPRPPGEEDGRLKAVVRGVTPPVLFGLARTARRRQRSRA
jgi:hypothetical protein